MAHTVGIPVAAGQDRVKRRTHRPTTSGQHVVRGETLERHRVGRDFRRIHAGVNRVTHPRGSPLHLRVLLCSMEVAAVAGTTWSTVTTVTAITRTLALGAAQIRATGRGIRPTRHHAWQLPALTAGVAVAAEVERSEQLDFQGLVQAVEVESSSSGGRPRT